jgi:hypothetical protein
MLNMFPVQLMFIVAVVSSLAPESVSTAPKLTFDMLKEQVCACAGTNMIKVKTISHRPILKQFLDLIGKPHC